MSITIVNWQLFALPRNTSNAIKYLVLNRFKCIFLLEVYKIDILIDCTNDNTFYSNYTKFYFFVILYYFFDHTY